MKTPEGITVSMALAKELKENGYPQDSLFYWEESSSGKGGHILMPSSVSRREGLSKELIAAPTASEIGEELPDYLTQGTGAPLIMRKWGTLYHAEYHRTFEAQLVKTISDETLANTLAKLWLHLKKNNLI